MQKQQNSHPHSLTALPLPPTAEENAAKPSWQYLFTTSSPCPWAPECHEDWGHQGLRIGNPGCEEELIWATKIYVELWVRREEPEGSLVPWMGKLGSKKTEEAEERKIQPEHESRLKKCGPSFTSMSPNPYFSF